MSHPNRTLKVARAAARTGSSTWSRRLASMALVVGIFGVSGAMGTGCLTRPVSTEPPTTKTNFTAVVNQTAVDKVDLLFMIDNSQSMGDKQDILEAAIPLLVSDLLTPACDDMNGNPVSTSTCTNGACTCPNGQKLEFPPVHDMHIGIVSSSLGGMSSDGCPEPQPNPINSGVDGHNNDMGQLINRSDPTNMQTEMTVADASGNGDDFLAWLPPVTANMGKPAPPVTALSNEMTLETDFKDLVSGVHQFGCGFEAQDEAWYRFLVQPDPYDHVSRDAGECATLPGGGKTSGSLQRAACLVGINKTILQQRHDFLRPDSLVAVIMVSDENSGEVVDPLSVSGEGWAYMQSNLNGGFPGTGSYAYAGTSLCGPTPVIGPNPGPISSGCTSCGFGQTPNDANCKAMNGVLNAQTDGLNVRGVNDKQRFGIDPRFPIARYVTGLTAGKVPDRTGEHKGGNYIGTPNCDNPLFSQNLPTDPGTPANDGYPSLCALNHGPRTPDLVFLAAITGVPHQLLQAKLGKDPECSGANAPKSGVQADCPQKGSFTDADWQLMLGKDPENYDFTGIDPHMFVSVAPRTGAPANLSPPSNMNNVDKINGREWNTQNNDQQYACIFPLTDSTGMATPRDCSVGAYASGSACDCTATRCGMGNTPSAACAGGFGAATCECPPLCGDGTMYPYTTQVNAKAYPSPREIEEVKDMGTQGILSSLCPIHTTDASGNGTDPLYGYNPAVNAIIQRLKNALANQCLPQKLSPNNCGSVACLVLETLPPNDQGKPCSSFAAQGLTDPDPTVLTQFQQNQHTIWLENGADAGGVDPSTLTTCQVTQLVTEPSFSADPGDKSGCESGQVSGSATNQGYTYVSLPGGSCGATTVSQAGWCYVTGAAAGTCPQALLFSMAGTPITGASVSLQCIESTSGVDAGPSNASGGD